MPMPYINAVELDIVPAEYEKFKAAILVKKYWEATAPMIAKRVARHMSPIVFNAKAR